MAFVRTREMEGTWVLTIGTTKKHNKENAKKTIIQQENSNVLQNDADDTQTPLPVCIVKFSTVSPCTVEWVN